MSGPETSTDAENDHRDLHSFWWLYLPILFFCCRYAIALFTNATTGVESWFRDEHGIVENLTVLLLVGALFCTLSVIVRFGKSLDPEFRFFLVVYCLGCIYFAGEEASWGQHWFGWETGEFFLKINSQQETNFHNTVIWLDRIPKGIVSFLIFVGGVVIPILYLCKSWKIDYQRRFWWIYPTLICTPTAIFASVTTWPSKIERYSGWNFYFSQAQETKELYIAYFILLFIVSLILRLPLSRQISGAVTGIRTGNNV